MPMALDTILGKRKRAAPLQQPSKHPYLSGNFAPIQKTCPLTPCSYTGNIPKELIGGEYVRNGSNPVSDEELGRDAHWFDGDGMLSGVLFKRPSRSEDKAEPQFVNQYILTDIFLSTISTPALRKPILPSITTLVNPFSTLIKICLSVFRAVLLVILSRFPGSKRVIKKISVANTSIMYHDGRALATCESGPPLRIQLPTLDTVGWYNGYRAEGEPETEQCDATIGGQGLLSFLKEWTTAHPKVDPQTNEMVLFHSNFIAPYVHYSVIPATHENWIRQHKGTKLVKSPVPGISSAKMMHDFGVSASHTIIMDLPLSLDPFNLAKGMAPIVYDSTKNSRFGIFPRHEPSNVRWFETSACCIFHTANAWDVYNSQGQLESVDMLVCRMTSGTLVFSAGNIAAPQPLVATVISAKTTKSEQEVNAPDTESFEKGPQIESPVTERTNLLWNSSTNYSTTNSTTTIHNCLPLQEEQCRLYYYSFSMSSKTGSTTSAPEIMHQWALSSIAFEFPSVRAEHEMSATRYVFGCTTTIGSFNSALGRASKIDALAKIDTAALIARGKAQPPTSVTGCVDTRSVVEIIAQQDLRANGSLDPFMASCLGDDTIQIFHTPPHHYAQEPRFVASAAPGAAEDDGYLLTYVFDERQLLANGDPPACSVSELWIIDAKGMRDVLAKVALPQRVPYGLHGSWFDEAMVLGQRPVERVRSMVSRDGEETNGEDRTWMQSAGRGFVGHVVKAIGG